MAHEYPAERVGSVEVLRTGEEASRGRPHYPSPLAPIIYLSTSALHYGRGPGGRGAGPADPGTAPANEQQSETPPNVYFQRGRERRRLLNDNQHSQF